MPIGSFRLNSISQLLASAGVITYTPGTLAYTLDNPNTFGTTPSDNFGISVAINDSYYVVGASGEADSSGAGSGRVYVYSTSGTGSVLYSISNPNGYNTGTGDRFGDTVELSQSYILVNAYGEDDFNGTTSGKCYVFNISDGSLKYTLNNPNAYNTSASDQFGYQSIAITDSYAVIGALGEDDINGTSVGKVYIFDMADGSLKYTLSNPNPTGTVANDYFGQKVAMNSTYAFASAPAEDTGGGSSGSVYVYNLSTGSLVTTIEDPNAYSTPNSDIFGWNAVAATDTHLIVGAYGEGDAGGTNSGKAYIFSTADWSLLYTLNNPNPVGTSANDFFGNWVDISTYYAIVSAHQEDFTLGSSGTAYVFNLNDGSLLYTFHNPNAYGTAASDNFSQYAVALTDNFALIGAHQEDDAGGLSSGKAYMFALPGLPKIQGAASVSSAFAVTADASVNLGASASILNSFTVTADCTVVPPAFGFYKVLDNPNAYTTSVGDFFGISTDVSDNYFIVGASQEDEAGGSGSGKAYIYSTSTGALLYTLNNPNAYNTVASDQFGLTVAISNNYAIVGAYPEDDAGGSASGKAYIYSTSTGSLLYTLNNPNAYGTSADDNFGFSLDISDNYAIVSAYQEDDATGLSSGKAYIYSTSTGSLLYTLNNPNPFDIGTSDFFGQSVGISNNYAIVGAPGEDETGNLGSGKAYIYSTSTGSLLYTLDNPNAYSTSAGDSFGSAVAISNNYVIVSAISEDDVGGGSSGKAYIFSTADWSLLYTLDNSNAYDTSLNDQFGTSVAISDNFALVGAWSEDDVGGTSSGKAYIFSTASGALLSTLDNPNAYNISPNDNFSRNNIGISNNYAIISAYNEDDAGGASSGKAYIYTNITAKQTSAPTPTGLSFVVSATSTTGSITIPATTRVGDIVILADTSTTVTDTLPSGFTRISGVTTTGIRTNISYRILTAGQPGSTITGMAGTTRKVLLSFREQSTTTPTLTITTPTTQATTAAPTTQTIAAGGADAASIYIVVGGATSSTPTIGFTQTGFTASPVNIASTSSTNTRFTVRDNGPNAIAQASVSVTMTDGGTNTLTSFRIDIT